MTGDELKKELRIHALQTTGNQAELVALLEEGRKQGAKCRWRGRVGELAAHMKECIREVACGLCTQRMECRMFAEHRAECDHEEVTCSCPGCDALLLRKDLVAHVESTHLGEAGAAAELVG